MRLIHYSALVSETQPPSHARYYKTCGKGVWAMAVQAFVQISGMLETRYDANYDVKLVVRVRRLVRAYTLVKV